MKNHLARLAAAAAMTAAAAFAFAPAQAQTRTVGNTDAAISQALVAFGFAPAFRIVDRELVRTVVEACRGRDMFRVSVNVLGAVKTKERRGRCDIPGARRDARATGNGGGDLREVRRRLRAEGYRAIEFTDRELPVYIALACDRRDRRVRLRINRRGEVRDASATGERCATGNRANPDRGSTNKDVVLNMLSGLGYTDIRFEKDTAPFRLTACRNGNRERMVVNRRGRVESGGLVGRCEERRRVTAETLTRDLRKAGLARVRVEREGRGFKATVCDKGRRFNITYNRRGDRTGREDTGLCVVRNARQILERLRERGATKVKLKVEGCFRGDRFHWTFDELGDRVDRERIGRC